MFQIGNLHVALRQPLKSCGPAFLLALIFALIAKTAQAGGTGVPLWALDYSCQFYDWTSGQLLKPELARLIEENAVIYHENFGSPGDAAYFDAFQDSMKIIHYLGFQNQNYAGPSEYVDPIGMVMTTEGNFCHSVDPASFVGWRTETGAELHWTKDLRFVQPSSFQDLNAPTIDREVLDYIVQRTNLTTGQLDSVAVDTTYYFDQGILPANQYEYRLFSVSVDNPSDIRPFSAIPVTIGVDPEPGPHFWAEKRDFQERLYYEMGSPDSAPVSADWPIQFYVDESLLSPEDLAVEVLQFNIFTSKVDTLTLTTVDYDNQTGAISATWATDTAKILNTGGVVYRLVYGGTTFPTGNRYMWSSINNRVLSCTWFAYLTNVEGEDWPVAYSEMAGRLFNGADPTGTGEVVYYDGILMDSVMALHDAVSNVIKPYEYTNATTYRAATASMIQGICTQYSSQGGFWANTGDLLLMEALEGTPGFAGCMNENFWLVGDSWRALGKVLWLFRKYPDWSNVMLNFMDFPTHPGDRGQVLAAYLLARAATLSAAKENSLFSFGDWLGAPGEFKDNISILPEQMITFGDVVNDPFQYVGPEDWPSAAEWLALLSQATPAGLVGVLSAYPDSSVITEEGGHIFATIEYELEDGLPEVVNIAKVVWDLQYDVPSAAQVSIAELFPEVDPDEVFYTLSYSGPLLANGLPNPLLVEGAIIEPDSVSAGLPLQWETGTQRVFFSAPISSPCVSPIALRALIPTPGVAPILEVRAEHWNGVALEELRVVVPEGSPFLADLWPAEFQLRDDGEVSGSGDVTAGDGIYSYEAAQPLAVPAGPYNFDVVATGTDGLKYYGDLELTVTDQVPEIGAAAVYPILADNPDTATVIAVQVTHPLGYQNLDVTFSNGLLGYHNLPMKDDGVLPDLVVNDNIYTAPQILVNVAAGTYANSTVYAEALIDRGGDGSYATATVEIEAISSPSKFVDGSANTGELDSNNAGNPYGSVYLNTEVDVPGQNILVVTKDNNVDSPQVFMRQQILEGAPGMTDMVDYWYGGVSVPSGGRGSCSADFNNDGRDDILICNNAAATRLYKNSGAGFVDVVDNADPNMNAFSPEEIGYLDRSHVAAWGDYNKDGFVDLVVATLSEPNLTLPDIDAATGLTTTISLFRGYGTHFERVEPAPFDITVPVLSLSWVDLNDDGLLDLALFGFKGLSSNPKVYLGQGYNSTLGDYSFAVSPSWGFDTSVRAMDWLDLDHDAYLDLVMVPNVLPDYARILRNNGSGFDIAFSDTLFPGAVIEAVLAGDLLQLGRDGVVAVPTTGNPIYYDIQYDAGTGSATSIDLGVTLGFQKVQIEAVSRSSGGTIADFNDDHDLDVYLGRPSTEVFLAQNVRPGFVSGDYQVALDNPMTTLQHWIAFELFPNGNSNASAIGAKVTISDGANQWMQVVDGGSGRGGQKANQLHFGLGNSIGPITCTVEWPSGSTTTVSGATVSGANPIPVYESGLPAVIAGKTTPKWTHEAFPGGSDWVFEWDTDIKGDLKRDRVDLSFQACVYLDPNDPDYCPPPGECVLGMPTSLHWGDPNVVITAYPLNGKWRHKLVLKDMFCSPEACPYQFVASSGAVLWQSGEPIIQMSSSGVKSWGNFGACLE